MAGKLLKAKIGNTDLKDNPAENLSGRWKMLIKDGRRPVTGLHGGMIRRVMKNKIRCLVLYPLTPYELMKLLHQILLQLGLIFLKH